MSETKKLFRAVVSGIGAYTDTVTWTVSGGVAGTSIDASGVLTVAAGETASALTVRATSTIDPSKSGTAAVKVTAVPAPTIRPIRPYPSPSAKPRSSP